jgi:transcription initiation factor TFIID subunit 1
LPKRLVTGTNADLRKLPLKDAKEICRQYGLIDDEINSLTRWEIIDVIRNLSTEAAKTRSTEFAGMVRFARGNVRATIADMQEKYKSYCQKIFDLQNQVLSGEVASSQLLEDASEIVAAPEKHPIEVEENSGPNRGGLKFKILYFLKLFRRNIYIFSVKSLFSSLSTLSDARKRQIEFEREERERLDLQKMIHGEVTKTGSTISTGAKEAAAANLGALPLADNPQRITFLFN